MFRPFLVPTLCMSLYCTHSQPDLISSSLPFAWKRKRVFLAEPLRFLVVKFTFLNERGKKDEWPHARAREVAVWRLSTFLGLP